MSLAIVIPSYRRPAESDFHHLWGDLRVALTSVDAYARGVEVVVAWDGPSEPCCLPANPCVRLLRRPPSVASSGQAWNWGIEQTDADEIVMMPDDAVLHPDTMALLLEDVAFLRQELPDAKLGMVACRSNFVVGPQNVRSANGGALAPNALSYDSENQILAAATLYPVVAWFPKAAHREIGGFTLGLEWYCDNLYCHDLKQAGYSLFVSRSYVHHVGMRTINGGKSTEQLNAEGLAWLRRHRPDFYAELMTG